MKVTLHVPVEQYGFVAYEMEIPPGAGSPESIVANLYKRIAIAFKEKRDAPAVNEELVIATREIEEMQDEGLPTKEWNKCLDDYLLEKGMSEECMHRLSPKQSWLIHELDKAFNRIKSKET